MLEVLKKKTRKSMIIATGICLVIAIGLLIFTKFAVFEVITGAKKLDVTTDPEKLEGHYVTMDVEYLLTDFVEHTTTTTKKYSSSKSTTVNGYSYIAFQPVVNEENNTATWYYYGVYVKKADQAKLNKMIDDTWNYLEDTTGSVNPPEPMTLKGTWSKMDASIEQYCMKALAEMGVTEGEDDIIRFYVLNTDKIGGQNQIFFWFLNIASAACILFAAYCVICIFSGAYQSEINVYLHRNPSVSMADIEADFAQSHQLINKKTWIGKRWTVYVQGFKAHIMTNKDLVWGYYFRRTGKNSVSELRLFDAKKNRYFISMSEECAHEALGYYSSEQLQMIAGYSSDLEKMFNKNFHEFLDLRYHPAMNSGEDHTNQVS